MQKVQTLFNGETEANQIMTVQIKGNQLPSGQYLIRFMADGKVKTQSVSLMND